MADDDLIETFDADDKPPSAEAVRARARAGRSLFDAVCVFLDAGGGDTGARMKGAVDAVGAVVGDEGARCLKEGDLVGCALEAARNARRKKRR